MRQVADTVWNPGIPTDKHSKKYVFGTVLKHARIALMRKNLVIDIILENGARGRNHTFLKYHLIIVSYKLSKILNWSTKRSTPQAFEGKLMSILNCNMWPNQRAMVTHRTTPYPLKGAQVTLE